MKTRKSIFGIGQYNKVLASSRQDDPFNSENSPPIVRKLRSRVIKSDTEDDAHVKSNTPKSQRKIIKKDNESIPPLCNEDARGSTNLRHTVALKTRTAKPKKRLSAINLFRIVEEKEEINVEECKGKEKEETNAKNDLDEVVSLDSEITSNDNAADQETAIHSNGALQKEESMLGEAEEDSSGRETPTAVLNEEDTEENETQEEEDLKRNELIEDEPMESGRDSDSDDDMPETMSFSSSKNMVNMELSVIAEAVRREKENRKDRVRKKIEMIRSQKAEKEKKYKEKMKFFEVRVPERLSEDVTNSLPDKPEIPTVRKSVSINKKRKIEEKEKIEHRAEGKKNKIMKFDDYIPITGVAGSTQFGVVPLEVASRLPKISSHSAAEFKQKALFGSRIQREPSKNLLIYRQKLSAAGRLKKVMHH